MGGNSGGGTPVQQQTVMQQLDPTIEKAMRWALLGAMHGTRPDGRPRPQPGGGGGGGNRGGGDPLTAQYEQGVWPHKPNMRTQEEQDLWPKLQNQLDKHGADALTSGRGQDMFRKLMWHNAQRQAASMGGSPYPIPPNPYVGGGHGGGGGNKNPRPTGLAPLPTGPIGPKPGPIKWPPRTPPAYQYNRPFPNLPPDTSQPWGPLAAAMGMR